MFWRGFSLVLLLMLNSAIFANVGGSAALTHIQLLNTDHSSRITLTFTKKPTCKIFMLTSPRRLVVDLSDTRKNFVAKKLNSRVISDFRVGYPKPNTLRLVFVLAQPIKFKIDAGRLQHQKLAIDIYSASEKKPQKKFIIVIDPGHGGKDSGAIGMNRSYEKNIVLSVSKKLVELINRQPNFKAYLTRNGDYYVTLRGRLQAARQYKADLFVAIHADAYFNTTASGASVYALSQRGATSEAARWLAKRENYSELDGVDLNELDNQNHFLRYVMIDLAQTATISDSLHLGNALIESLQQVTKLRYPRVEQAPFMVLKSPDIPSVLVEIGFISNPKEEMRLRDSHYQNALAKALLKGLIKFAVVQRAFSI